MNIFSQPWKAAGGAVFLLLVSASTLPGAHAQQVQQGLNQEAWQVQRGMQSGVINGAQGAALDNQIYNIQQQSQLDRSVNGGHLNQAQRMQLGQEMQGVRQQMGGSAMQNGFSPQSMFGGHHHHQFNGAMGAYNNNGYGGYGGYPAQGGQIPYQNQGYNAYNNGFNGYNNGYGGYGQGYQTQRSLSGAANMLKRLF
jgi:hypothetical protein